MIYVIMGVSGSGKSTVGVSVSQLLACDFIEGDDFHSRENKEKMSRGIPLSDHDRIPWLQEINRFVFTHYKQSNAVLACSALKEKYRAILSDQLEMIFFLLAPSVALLEKRLMERSDHFMSPSLLSSQLEILEITNDLTVISEDLPPLILARKISTYFN